MAYKNKQVTKQVFFRVPLGNIQWRFFTIEEASVELKVAPRTVLKLLRQRRLPGFKVGRQWRISELVLHRVMGAKI